MKELQNVTALVVALDKTANGADGTSENYDFFVILLF